MFWILCPQMPSKSNYRPESTGACIDRRNQTRPFYGGAGADVALTFRLRERRETSQEVRWTSKFESAHSAQLQIGFHRLS